MNSLAARILICLSAIPFAALSAAEVSLANVSATFSQTFNGPNDASHMIDGVLTGNNGWSVLDNDLTTTSAQTAVFETVGDVTGGPLNEFTFSLIQQWFIDSFNQHLIGRFRISVTGEDRSTFADGLQTGGDVDANWTIFEPTSVSSTDGVTLTILGDESVLASGLLPAFATYTVVGVTSLPSVTGVRLEALEDVSLPTGGPGRYENGNFALTEFTFETNPIPETASVSFALALTALCVASRRR